MPHRIVVLGAGYAGASAAGYLARRLHATDFEITVVNAEADFVERMRLHQLAAGRDPRRRPLTEMFAGTGIQLRLGRVTAVDAEDRTVTVTDDDGADRIDYDTLLYALGSTAADHGIPGVNEHAFHVAGRPAALRLRQRLDDLGGTGTVLVVGGNLTAIEAATEIAESRPGLQVTLATSDELGGWLGTKARRHLRRAFDRFGIEVHEHTTVTQVTATGAVAADGTTFASDATVWAAGFAVPSIAAAGGLDVRAGGRITVDRQMRSVSHPEVYAAGDSAYAIGENGRPLPMSCASAGVHQDAGDGRDHRGPDRQPYREDLVGVSRHLHSLGGNDAILQLVDGNARSKSWSLRGRTAVRYKAAVLSGAAWSMGHPTYGLPKRKRRLAPALGRAVEAVAA